MRMVVAFALVATLALSAQAADPPEVTIDGNVGDVMELVPKLFELKAKVSVRIQPSIEVMLKDEKFTKDFKKAFGDCCAKITAEVKELRLPILMLTAANDEDSIFKIMELIEKHYKLKKADNVVDRGDAIIIAYLTSKGVIILKKA